MLKKFTVCNYRNLESEVVLDFSNVRAYEFNQTCIKNKLINKALLYGKNAVGKTNLGRALMDIRNILSDQGMKSDRNYVHANHINENVKFSYTFVIDDTEILYTYKRNKDGQLMYEYMEISNEMLYICDFVSEHYNFERLQTYKELQHLNFEFWDHDLPVFRYILTNAKLQELKILKKLQRFISSIGFLRATDAGVQFRGPRFLNRSLRQEIIEGNLLEEFMEFLKVEAELDLPLKIDLKPDGEKAIYFNYEQPIDFIQYASSGTRSLMALFVFYKYLDQCSFLYMDEFDANFHFELASNIFKLFRDKTDCQMIMTTHNTDLLSNAYLRPDCYLLLSEQGITSVADATIRELRMGHNLEKLYQSGEFGG